MNTYSVRLRAAARRQANALYDFIAAEADPIIADRFVQSILDRCETLATFPERGSPRPELGAGIRSITFQRRTRIVYFVTDDTVEIAGIFYGGQDIGADFAPD